MTLTITPFDAPIGAEVTGVDLRNAFDKSIVDEIYQAWLDHLVLIFRGQSLSKDEQVAFANQFGDVGIRATPKDVQNEVANGYDGSIMLVTNQVQMRVLGALLPPNCIFFCPRLLSLVNKHI